MIKYIASPLSVTDKAAFTEASREELRILLAIIEAGGEFSDEAALAEAAGVSLARTRSSLVLWEEEGVIRRADEYTAPTAPASHTVPTVTDEFESRIELGKITDRSTGTAAREIRDNDLADLLAECAAMMDKPVLSTEEAKIISAIYTQLKLGEEYIITLAAFLAEKGKLSAQRLGAEAEKLLKRGVDCVEELEKYFVAKENESGAEWEFKRLLGIYNRNLSKREREIVNKWYYTFGFSDEIIGEAYDIMTMKDSTKISLPYMDKVLTHWHEEGCRTLPECRRLSEREHAALEAERAASKPPSIPRTAAPKPRYGDFDVNDAFEKALLRSYGDDSKK